MSALGPATEHAIDISGVGHQSAHLAADPSQHLNRDVGERFLEMREVSAGEAGERPLAR